MRKDYELKRNEKRGVLLQDVRRELERQMTAKTLGKIPYTAITESLEQAVLRIWDKNNSIRGEFMEFGTFVDFMENVMEGRKEILDDNPKPGKMNDLHG